MGQKLLAAIQAYKNLISLEISPKIYHPDIFLEILPSVALKTTLQELVVNSACATESSASMLVRIGHGHLENLSLLDPTRAILNELPGWLGHLSSTLVGLHLKVTANTSQTVALLILSFVG